MAETPPDARWQAVAAPHGIAALRHTHWLDDTPRGYEGAPGLWWSDGERVHGRDLTDGREVSLAPFEEIDEGPLLLRAFARDEAHALRVYDPETPGRLSLAGIESYPHDTRWVTKGSFTPAEGGAQIVVRSVDGHERATAATGTVDLEVNGAQVSLTVSRDGEGFSAVIADASIDDGAYRFRFLPIGAPDADGLVTVDFTRAYLPPCAFSDHYVCPLPPAGNRLSFAVTAGEKRTVTR